MLIGIVSDTHGNLEAVSRVAASFLEAGVDKVIHLGDDYTDIRELTAVGLQVIAVPGLYCPEYCAPNIPRRRIESFNGMKVLLTHTPSRHSSDKPGDLVPENCPPEVSLVLYGHTHIPRIKEQGRVLWVNPGHLKARDSRGYPLTYALISFDPDWVRVEIRALDTNEIIAASEKQRPF
jgi:uncharacterized protein